VNLWVGGTDAMTENNWLSYLSDPSQTLADSMTESEWLACDDPLALQRLIPRFKISDRRVRLFACACCHRIWKSVTDGRLRAAVDVAERYADGLATAADLEQARESAFEASNALEGQPAWHAAACAMGALVDLDGQMAHGVAQSATFTIADAAGLNYLNEEQSEAWGKAVEAANQELMLLFHDIAGNPFRSTTLCPSLRTKNLVELAKAIYQDRAFDRLPILADALEEAGCTDAAILEHCRGSGPHVRACWVIDLLLGKS
jgi:hypothetical protein